MLFFFLSVDSLDFGRLFDDFKVLIIWNIPVVKHSQIPLTLPHFLIVTISCLS